MKFLLDFPACIISLVRFHVALLYGFVPPLVHIWMPLECLWQTLDARSTSVLARGHHLLYSIEPNANRTRVSLSSRIGRFFMRTSKMRRKSLDLSKMRGY